MPVFEQPLNEYMRICLRLETLFQLIDANIEVPHSFNSKITLETILSILNVTNRPELRGKLCKVLNEHAGRLKRLKKNPQINHQRLNSLLRDVDDLIDQLYQERDKIGQKLRENPFLNSLRLNLTTPGSADSSTVPAYHSWASQPPSLCIQDLRRWITELKPLKDVIEFILKLTRHSASYQSTVAKKGFYQQNLLSSNQLNYQLLRIRLPLTQAYPDISVSPQRFTIHIFRLDTQARPSQVQEDVPFEISTCL